MLIADAQMVLTLSVFLIWICDVSMMKLKRRRSMLKAGWR